MIDAKLNDLNILFYPKQGEAEKSGGELTQLILYISLYLLSNQ